VSQASTFTDLLDLLLLEVPGCSTVIATQHLQQSARQFCSDTEAFKEELAAIDLEEDDVTYTLTPTYDCEIRRIDEVWIRTEEDVTNGNDGTLQAYDKYTFDPLTNVLTLDDSIEPQEDVTDGLVVKVSLVPYLKTNVWVGTPTNAGGITAAFLNLWAEPILAYAKYTLMRMPAKPWSNPSLAGVYKADYDAGVTDARVETESLKYRTEADGFGA